jgi:hypothetical protein
MLPRQPERARWGNPVSSVRQFPDVRSRREP